ncbi:multidrug ABC transporter ATP-binding protein [Streptomyces mashuensis]|uniref:Multidrug ABC transporter ATP-binding protein n=1 Tax=Streptomyces mashuensis TaxID=33904 RepID=A0A919B4S5_9ACTN|nr:ABC transporter ATP-binding protein [Streptomyces mashuensis]GHF53124.1 multidrug ABC transporter ATP-binding protein [Streptomyces mashuensis]
MVTTRGPAPRHRTGPVPPDAVAVDIAGLWVSRGRHTILRGIDLTIARGSITGLVGPSGCGKTTLMRAVTGTQRIARGSVRVLGRPAGDASLRGRIGYDPQAAALHTDLTVTEELRYFAAVLGAPPCDVQRVIAELRLQDHAGRLVGRLSGGQRSRASLAVALLGTPELLILDEPTVGLDPLLRDELWQLFVALAERGITLLVSTHVMDEAIRCPRVALMHHGTVLACAAPAELCAGTGRSGLEDAFKDLITASTGGPR